MKLRHEHNKELLLRAFTLMQGLMDDAFDSDPCEGPCSEYTLKLMRWDIATCSAEEKATLTSIAQLVSELAFKRRMPTLWLLKNRHPVFAVYASVCLSIGRDPLDEWTWLEDDDFKTMTEYGHQLVYSPVIIVGINQETLLSDALRNLPGKEKPWTVLCDWQFDSNDEATAKLLGEDGTACVLRPG